MLKKRGVALILALFATAILVTLGAAFLALAVGESRTSRTAGYEGASIEAANFGIEYALNYMGLGNSTLTSDSGSTFSCWESKPWPDGIGFYNTLTRYTTPRLHQTYRVIVEDMTDDPTLVQYADSSLQSAVRKIRIVLPATRGRPDSAVIPLDNSNQLFFTFEVVVVPVLGKTRVTSYNLISTARIFNGVIQGSIVGTTRPVATRVIQAQVLPEDPASYLHFLANGRSFSVQGLAEGDNTTVTVAGQTTSIADYARIPANYTENGPLRIDGQDPRKKKLGPGFTAWVNNSGNLKFEPGAKGTAHGGNVTFRDPVFINQTRNEYLDNSVDDTNAGIFAGGFRTQVPRLGLPSENLADFASAAKQIPNPNPNAARAAFYQVNTQDIPGTKNNSVPAPRGTGADPFIDHYNPTTLPDGTVAQVPVFFDYRPRVPNVEITLDGDQVTVQTKDISTGNVLRADSFKVGNLTNGVLYVDGGDTVVKSGTSPFKGQLSIVAGESAARKYTDATTPVTAESVYAQGASELFAREKARSEVDRAAGHLASDYQTPPYTAKQLRDSGILSSAAASQLVGVADQQKLWPVPPPHVDREGNIVVADDVRYADDRATTLGLFAQKFVLLNDNTPDNNNRHLHIDAVMMSFERSVQLDWDNSGHQNQATWAEFMKPGFNGVIELRGSIVGEFVDIEGDAQGRGYTVQDFTHDVNLRNQRPPLCPVWNFASLPGGYRFAITHYSDRGALSTENVL